MAQIMLNRIPSKIKFYEVSHDAKDEIVIKRYLNEAIEELNNTR